MEISQGTYIAQNEQDVGNKFESTALFKMTSVHSEEITISLPPQVGPFFISAQGKNNFSLPPNGSFTITVTFRPTLQTAQAGLVSMPFRLGGDLLTLEGMALDPQGKSTFDLVDENGNTSAKDIDEIQFEEIQLPTNPVKRYFRCKNIRCQKKMMPTECHSCNPIDEEQCLLHPIDSHTLKLAL